MILCPTIAILELFRITRRKRIEQLMLEEYEFKFYVQ